MFIPRDNGPEAIAMIRRLGQNVDSTTAIVIFPEGRLFRPDRLERAKTRLALENPERAARLASLSHVLPPRPGGVLALVDTIAADVVVIAHTGLDQYASFTDLAKAVPAPRPDPRHRMASPARSDPGWRRRTHRMARRTMAARRRVRRPATRNRRRAPSVATRLRRQRQRGIWASRSASHAQAFTGGRSRPFVGRTGPLPGASVADRR